jgi:hypothetical protein
MKHLPDPRHGARHRGRVAHVGHDDVQPLAVLIAQPLQVLLDAGA